MRPKPPGHVWAWIVVAVSIVIFLALGAWLTRTSVVEERQPRLSDQDTVHRLARRFKERWRQVPGPPSIYLAQGIAAYRRGDVPEAVRRLGMSVALHPDGVDAWLWLVVASLEQPAMDDSLSASDSGALVYAVGQLRPNHPLLPVALGRIALHQGANERALISVGARPETLPGRVLRLQAMGSKATVMDAQSVLSLAPAHTGACLVAARVMSDSGAYREAIGILDGCLGAGAGVSVAKRIAELRTSSGSDWPETLDSTAVPD